MLVSGNLRYYERVAVAQLLFQSDHVADLRNTISLPAHPRVLPSHQVSVALSPSSSRASPTPAACPPTCLATTYSASMTAFRGWYCHPEAGPPRYRWAVRVCPSDAD